MKNGPSPAIEAEYIVPGETSVDAITRSLQSLLPTRQRQIARQRFTVLDTFDGRVRRARACLTRRGHNGDSTVGWQPPDGKSHLTLRLKQPVAFAWDLPDGPLHQALAPVIGPRRLLDQANAEEEGALLEILDDCGKTVARLKIARGQARLAASRGAWCTLPTMMTLTGLRGYEGAFARLVRVIESRPGITSCPESRADMMLRRAGVLLPDDFSSPPVALEPTVRADVGARKIHAALLDVLTTNEPGLRANLDSEFLHDFRVAVRRTRSLLGQIREIFPPELTEHFAAEFSWIGRLTGPPRDLDVLVLALRERRAELSPEDTEALLAFLGQTQQQEHLGLVRALDSDRYRRLLSDWKAFLEDPASARPAARNARGPLAAAVSKRAWRLSRRIAESAEKIDEQSTAARLHEVRIDAKKLRYLVDVMPAFYDAADFECILGALKKLQRVLGDFNDATVQEQRLVKCGHGLPTACGPAAVLIGLGRLAEQSRQRGERLRGQAVEQLARFCARDTQSACRRAFRERAR